jgi:hypothetical protein
MKKTLDSGERLDRVVQAKFALLESSPLEGIRFEQGVGDAGSIAPSWRHENTKGGWQSV